MEDLLQSQIRDSCKLALPDGLRDLMCDISREVLRARPQNLYQFIADYLAAMLVARETLTIAGHVCKGVCECSCEPELDDELRSIGLSQEEAVEAKKIIIQYLEKDKVKEESLLAKLLKTNIDKEKLADIQKAVKAAYKRKLLQRNAFFEYSSSEDSATRAAKETLEFYLKLGSAERNRQPTSNDIQPPFSNQKQEKVHDTTEASSTDSSGCMFKNVFYDCGLKDLYVSSNCKPYKNSSLTSLAGSYGTPLATKEEPATTIPREHLLTLDKEYDKENSDLIKSQKRQVHLNLTDEKNESGEINRVDSVNENEEDIGEDIGEEFGCFEEGSNSDNESDLSIVEVIDGE